jgi:tRNA G10  N-methylase Trm11
LAQVTQSSYVLDPFVGTGSLLIPPAHFGAYVTGCDIDIRVLRGYSVGYSKEITMEKNKNKIAEKIGKKKENVKNEIEDSEEPSNIFTNFIHYKLPLPNIVRADINYICFRKGEYFDTIICDPPYGHRAFSRKTGITEKKKAKREERLAKKYSNFKKEGESQSNINENVVLSEDNIDMICDKMEEINIGTNNEPDVNSKGKKDHPVYFSPMNQCSVETIFENLLNLGSQSLKAAGLLVCLYPTSKPKDDKGK